MKLYIFLVAVVLKSKNIIHCCKLSYDSYQYIPGFKYANYHLLADIAYSNLQLDLTAPHIQTCHTPYLGSITNTKHLFQKCYNYTAGNHTTVGPKNYNFCGFIVHLNAFPIVNRPSNSVVLRI